MIISIIGPTRSGKSTLGSALAADLRTPMVDVGQLIRLTTDITDQERINAGGLSSRGGTGTDWVNKILDKSIKEYKNFIIVGYPRSDTQLLHLQHSTVKVFTVCVLASLEAIEQRSNRGRPDDLNRDALLIKLDQFYQYLGWNWSSVDMFIVNEHEPINQIANSIVQRVIQSWAAE